MHTRFDNHLSFETAAAAREIGLENLLETNEYHLEYSRMSKHLPLHSLYASTYLQTAEPYLSQLVSPDNLKDILSIARHFPGNLTSFLGFECRLGEQETRTDWAFAISGVGSDRLVLTNLLNQGYLPEQFTIQPEWRHIKDFTAIWTNPNSVLNDKVKCFWIEFDMPKSTPDVHVPSVFFGPTTLPNGVSSNDISHYQWLITSALPLLTGEQLPKVIEQQLYDCIRQMPKQTSLFQVGTMLSRTPDSSVRLYITRFQSEQVIPYLNAIGWTHNTKEFFTFISELKHQADRFVLSFDVTKTGIGPRVGIECSFTPDRFHLETRWAQLLDYLVGKGLCLPEKRDALLSYPGAGNTEQFSGSIMKPVTSVSQDLNQILSSTLVRYISHIKLVYQPGHPLEAKAYPAVRLFEFPQESRMIPEGGT